MKKIHIILAFVLLSFSVPVQASAAMQGESIYDLLVDRYFNQTNQNDIDANTQDPAAFAGGDFLGIINRLDHIKDMGFTYISMGPVFETSDYKGSSITNYSTVAPHFGTVEDFKHLLETLQSQNMKAMIDLPLAQAEEAEFSEMKQFLETFPVDGVKLTGISENTSPRLASFIEEINTDELDVIALEESDLPVDVTYSEERVNAFQQAFKTTDQPTEGLEGLASTDLLAIDTLASNRFTYVSTEENMFPPTRVKMAVGALLTLPGVPLMTYGTEIAMNGNSDETSHQIMNFRVDEDIMLFIEDLQTIRNQSQALQVGDMEMLENDNGYMVFKRSTEEESFIVVINNTSATQTFTASEELIGKDKELRGLFEQDIVRQDADGNYKLVLDREIVELYHVKEDSGLNMAYIVAMIIAYALFLAFIYLVWRKGKQKQQQT
ncbi:alpha-amylase family glycosyl hydrolase [Chryseomicrobium palamuruense]|uniref:Alpha-amylase family glycosyl hydrolase n=1 Tax=Chryseomicrobium palamuruense TaxID=682973 RepID=A0ABV8UQP3_9BACL